MLFVSLLLCALVVHRAAHLVLASHAELDRATLIPWCSCLPLTAWFSSQAHDGDSVVGVTETGRFYLLADAFRMLGPGYTPLPLPAEITGAGGAAEEVLRPCVVRRLHIGV